MTDPRLDALFAKVDAFFDRVTDRHGDRMRCAPGCDGCCRVQLTVTPVEADALRAHAATLAPDRREALRRRALAPTPDRCAALADDGRCDVHPARPLVCRSHGAPIRLREPGRLPVVTSCALNFTGDGGSAAADADCVLDQQTLSTLLGAVDAAFARDRGVSPGERVALCEALAEGAGAATVPRDDGSRR